MYKKIFQISKVFLKVGMLMGIYTITVNASAEDAFGSQIAAHNNTRIQRSRDVLEMNDVLTRKPGNLGRSRANTTVERNGREEIHRTRIQRPVPVKNQNFFSKLFYGQQVETENHEMETKFKIRSYIPPLTSLSFVGVTAAYVCYNGLDLAPLQPYIPPLLEALFKLGPKLFS